MKTFIQFLCQFCWPTGTIITRPAIVDSIHPPASNIAHQKSLSAVMLKGFLLSVARDGEISNLVVQDMIDFIEVIKEIEAS